MKDNDVPKCYQRKSKVLEIYPVNSSFYKAISCVQEMRTEIFYKSCCKYLNIAYRCEILDYML